MKAFLNMEPRPNDEEAQRVMNTPELRLKVLQQIESGPSIALPNTDTPAMVCGALISDEFVEVWMIAGVGFEKHLRVLLRQQRQLLANFQQIFAPRQLKILVNPERASAAKYVQRLGFTYEKKKTIDVYCFNLGKG